MAFALFGVIALVTGLLSIFAPGTMWKLNNTTGRNWMFSNRPSPSGAGIAVQRVSGLVGVAFGVIMIILAFTH